MPSTEPFALRDVFSREYSSSLVVALILLGLSFVAQHLASVYALEYSSRPTSTYVGDIILDTIPVVNLNLIIIDGALLAIVIVSIFLLFQPRYILFTLKAVALFIATRALFISLTHVGIHPEQISVGVGLFSSIYSYFNFHLGFFFSGHTGLPLLMSLIFWNNPTIRTIFLLLALVFAVSVLFAHIHYSIDVLASPFMVYGLYKISQRLFPRDFALIETPSHL